MPHTVRELARAGALACTIVGSAAAQVEFTNNFRFNSGQSVQPIFEGWSLLPDGSFKMHFGYLNRNYVERPSVPVGVNNNIEPGGPDRGQPTYFYPRTHRNLFTVHVPKEWDRKREIIWTVTVNGKTERAFGWLQKDWEIDPVGGASGGGNTNPERLKNKPPTLTIEALSAIALASQTSITAVVVDDGLPKPQPRRKPAVGQETPPTLQGGGDAPINVPQVAAAVAAQRPPGATPAGGTAAAAGTTAAAGAAATDGGQQAPQGLRVSWIVWRGPADATFEPRTATVKDGRAVSTVMFTKPGEYVVRGTATDSQASTVEHISVTVR
jgi:hypothetical protein